MTISNKDSRNTVKNLKMGSFLIFNFPTHNGIVIKENRNVGENSPMNLITILEKNERQKMIKELQIKGACLLLRLMCLILLMLILSTSTKKF